MSLTWSDNAHVILCQRYLAHRPDRHQDTCPRCNRQHETPEEMLDRTSFSNPDFYDLMTRKDFLPNSPTLFNAGLPSGGTFSGCFKFDVADSMLGEGSITDVATLAAAVQKWGGGVGYSVSDVRGKGTSVNSTHGKACGPISVLKHYHSVAYNLITQGGKRNGAQMGILHVNHPDIREFIQCKDESPTELSSFNLSVAMTDEVMRRALADPSSPEGELLLLMAESAHRTGDPGMYFIDVAERGNPTPWLGKLTGTNPCGEVPLLNLEACNLGSLNLTNFITDLPAHGLERWNLPRVDFERLAEVTRTAVRFLDTILDHNKFPDPRITAATLRTRKLGLGVMGWADLLMMLHIPYDSAEALELASRVMQTIQSAAQQESAELALEKGVFPALGLMPDLFGRHGSVPRRRNATLTSIAPTGSISILAGVSSGIEPHYALLNNRFLGDGTKLVERVQTNGFTPKVAHEISWQWHIAHQAAFQRHTDLAVSKTINLPEEATVEDIQSAYVMLWEQGCKGGTVYRDKSRSEQILQATCPTCDT